MMTAKGCNKALKSNFVVLGRTLPNPERIFN